MRVTWLALKPSKSKNEAYFKLLCSGKSILGELYNRAFMGIGRRSLSLLSKALQKFSLTFPKILLIFLTVP